jgi:hypothetical protein
METPADYEAAIDWYLSEMQRLSEKMRQDQSEIDRLAVETAALDEETQRLKVETRAILQRLNAAV